MGAASPPDLNREDLRGEDQWREDLRREDLRREDLRREDLRPRAAGRLVLRARPLGETAEAAVGAGAWR